MKSQSAPPVVIIDDNPDILNCCQTLLEVDGVENIRCCRDGAAALRLIESAGARLVLLDLVMPGLSGMELLPLLLARCPDTPVVVISGEQDIATAVNCIKKGAYDYLNKPIDPERLVTTVRRALEWCSVERENSRLKESIATGRPRRQEAFQEFITNAPRTLTILAYAEVVAASPRPVLITGESGTGKELLARAIHRLSERAARKMVTVNVAGLDELMFSDTLFGHARGAFTGAADGRPGLVEKANDGTLFLDEIGDLHAASQVKLLRLLQEGEYFPLGVDEPRSSTARIVVATNLDLEERTRDGKFRADLYHRLRTHHVHLPPLRERTADIPPLVERFIEKAARALNARPPLMAAESLTLLAQYSFPGNVRELETIIFDAVARHHADGAIPAGFFRELRGKLTPPAPRTASLETNPFAPLPMLPTPQEARGLLFAEALRRSNGNQAVAARMLGVTPQALCNHLLRHGHA